MVSSLVLQFIFEKKQKKHLNIDVFSTQTQKKLLFMGV